MIPSRLDIVIWRGVDLELELVAQEKVYTYDPAIHNSVADQKRTHEENLEHYGYTYEYIDFASLYTGASLVVVKPWEKSQAAAAGRPLMTLTLDAQDIVFTNRSVQVGIPGADTKKLVFDDGDYELLLTTADGKIDGIVYGKISVCGSR